MNVRIGNILILVAVASSWGIAADRDEFFERRVRPILVANCFSCHGAKKQESGLRLDSRAAILKGGDGGEVVKPGDTAQSRLLAALRRDGDLKMPPAAPLKPTEIAVLEQWISAGAPWPEPAEAVAQASDDWRRHWAFQPVKRPPLPAVADAGRSRNAIDHFIVAELTKHGLAPTAEADRPTLIRRASFDLLGLPPTPDEVADFMADNSPDAYDRLVDRLLASPRYGERWGRHWLDVARYADTKGYVFFEEKSYPWAYTYRDYVIAALNADVPYDRFLLEQLAADQLPNVVDRSAISSFDRGAINDDDQRPLTALGFLTVGAHFMNNTHDIVDDRIDVVTRGLLGLTVTCARCHDHKYDPIPTTDYYALYGVFRSCFEPTVPPTVHPPADDDALRKFAAELAAREKKLVDFVTGKHSGLVSDARRRAGDYLFAAYQLRDQPPTEDFMLLTDTGDLNPAMTVRWQAYLAERKTDPIWSPWHALGELPPAAFAERATATVEQACLPNAGSPSNRLVRDALRVAPLTSMSDVAKRFGELFVSVDQQWQAAVREAAEAEQPAPTRLADDAAENLRRVLYGEDAPPDVPLAMDWGFLSLFPDRPTQGEYEKLLKEVEKWMMTEKVAPPRAMVLFDAERPITPRVFPRGNPNRLGERVPRRFLSALDERGQPFEHGSGRLDLARAIVDRANPLTARVIVNRVWMHYFGQGLVNTPSDFGLRSEPPSHPELLDWLAGEFGDLGFGDLPMSSVTKSPNPKSANQQMAWSLKQLHRLIVTSATYRQASVIPQSEFRNPHSSDPENRFLARAPRRRLEFEAQRDALLAVAGSLDLRLGGPAIALLGDAVVPRRTIYGVIDRLDVPPLLTTFDFPNPLTTSPQRSSTTIAPQSLFAMNSPFVSEIARRLATRSDVASLGNSVERITRQYHICFARAPQSEELSSALEFLGPNPTDEQWHRFAHALLMTNEFVFVD